MEDRSILAKLKNYLPLALVVAGAALARVLPHVPNATPITAVALFSGAKLSRKQALLLPLLAMVVSDLVLGWHSTLPFVYVSFALIALLGQLVKRLSVTRLALVAVGSSVLFYVVTNFGVWIATDLYPKTLTGLIDSYIRAIPFFRNMLIGDLVYSFGLFYGYEFIVAAVRQFHNKSSHARHYQ